MAIAPRFDMKQSHAMVMTAHMRQAIQLLQFSNMEAAQFIDDELLTNPLLERADNAEQTDGEIPAPAEAEPAEAPAESMDTANLVESATLPDPADAPLDMAMNEGYEPGSVAEGGGNHAGDEDDNWNLFASIAEQPSLREHIEQQARLAFPEPADQLVAGALVAALDEAGRISETPETIAVSLGTTTAHVERIRGVMMRFDPVGLFAQNLVECLAAQLTEQNRLDPAMAALLNNLELLARREMRALCILCGVDLAELAEMVGEIRRLDPKPGARYRTESLRPLIPDVLMRPLPITGDGTFDWMIEINSETLPKVAIRHGFYARMTSAASRETKSFLNEKMQNAKRLVKALDARSQTILRVAASIIRHQEEFFQHGISHLKPLTLRDISADVELHESTVSRVTSNKSMATPRGIFELRFFFTTALSGTNGELHSAETVRRRVQVLISDEDPKAVLSDDSVAAMLRKEGIDIARRTVAKYREALHIPGSAQRKRLKQSAFQI